ncbi:hypothetical protein Tco_1256580 [Tanacetum coccineum]
MYNKKNVDYVALLWEDFMYQANNREISSARKEHMPYPRFTKFIINHFISKDKTISKRNRINLYTMTHCSTSKILQLTRLTTTLLLEKFLPGKQGSIRKLLHLQENYLLSKKRNMSRRIKELRDTPSVSVSKKKAPTKADRSKGIEILYDVALSEVGQLKEATNRSKKDYHISQASGSSDGTDFESRVPDEQQRKTSSTDEGTGTKLGVPDVPTYDFESENESCGDSEDDNNDDSNDDSDDDNKGDDNKADSDNDGNSDADDNERTYSDDDDDNSSFTLKDYDEEEHDDEYETDDHNENVFEEEDDDLYKDVDVRSLGAEQEKERKGNEEMTDDDQNVSQEKSYEQVVEDAHVTLTSS